MPRTRTEPLTDCAAFTAAVDKIAELQTTLDLLVANRNEQVQETQESFNPRIKAIETEIRLLVTQCETYALTHEPTLFDHGKVSGDTALAEFGLRQGQPQLRVLGGKTQAQAAQALAMDGHVEFLQPPRPTLAKDAIIDRLKHGAYPVLSRLFSLTRTRRFWVKAKASE